MDVSAWGLLGVFFTAFLAGSVVPIPSEAALVAAIALGHWPWAAVGAATVGNVLGAGTLYLLARYVAARGGGKLQAWLARRGARNAARMERARTWLRRYGAPALVLSWMPIIGDAFVLAAGATGVGWLPFVVFVTMGKGLRYTIVAVSTVAAMSA